MKVYNLVPKKEVPAIFGKTSVKDAITSDGKYRITLTTKNNKTSIEAINLFTGRKVKDAAIVGECVA